MSRTAGGHDNIGAGVTCSIMLHALAVLLALFGLPHLMTPPKEMEEPIAVEVETIAEKTNPPPRQVEAPKPEEKPPEPPKQEETPPPVPTPPPPKPPEPTPPPPPPPPPVPPPPTPKPPPPEPDPIPAPVPQPKPKPPEPAKPPPPDPLKDLKPPPKKPPPPPDDLDILKSSIDKLRQPAKPPSPQPQSNPVPAQKTVNSPTLDPSAKPTISEIDFIKRQIEERWNFDPGAKGIDTFTVIIHISVAPDGKILSARFDDSARSRRGSEKAYESFSDTAMRAVLSSVQLKAPPSRPDIFKANPDINLTFDPRSLAR